jgi:hypothetical protein
MSSLDISHASIERTNPERVRNEMKTGVVTEREE